MTAHDCVIDICATFWWSAMSTHTRMISISHFVAAPPYIAAPPAPPGFLPRPSQARFLRVRVYMPGAPILSAKQRPMAPKTFLAKNGSKREGSSDRTDRPWIPDRAIPGADRYPRVAVARARRENRMILETICDCMKMLIMAKITERDRSALRSQYALLQAPIAL